MADQHVIGGRYTLGEMLGYGGMATVYHGLDTVTGQAVAIKLLKPEIIALDPDIVQRFEREGQALRRLNHPNIVKVLATVEQDEQHYVVMELVGGGDLRVHLDDLRKRGEQMPLRRVMEIGLDLSDALTRAHRLQIVHRDLKPANVLLAEDGTPRLTDFGVAHFGDATRMTQTGAMIGTMSYLSPEVCMGQSADSRSDIWSFGVLLYEMLTLRRPFEANGSTALLLKIMQEDVPSLVELRPDTQPELVNLVERMLAKDPDERINSVRFVGAQLEAILFDRDLPESTPTPTQAPVITPPITEAAKTPVWPQVPDTVDSGEFLPGEKATSRENRAQMTPRQTRQLAPLIVLGVVAMLVIILGTVFALSNSGTPSPAAAVSVAPVADGNYMVLVAALDPIDTERTNPQTLIARDLRDWFERDFGGLSNVEVRTVPITVDSAEQATEIAEQFDAHVILWGQYYEDRSEVRVQSGDLDLLTKSQFSRETITALTDARIVLDDRSRQSMVHSALAVLGVLHVANSAVADLVQVFAMLDILAEREIDQPEIIGISTGDDWHRYYYNLMSDTDESVRLATAVSERISNNALVFIGRGFAYQRTGQLEEAREDLERLSLISEVSLDEWTIPHYLEAQEAIFLRDNPTAAYPEYQTAAEINPDDWYASGMAGIIGVMIEDDAAPTYLRQSIAAGPDFNFPYMFNLLVALRAVDLQAAWESWQAVAAFSDPRLTTQLLESVYDVESQIAESAAALGYATQRQWSDALAALDAAYALDTPFIETYMPDMFLLEGFVHCNQANYAEAEAAYTRLIDLRPTYTVAHLLRAEVRLAQDDRLGALADIGVVNQSAQGEGLQSLIVVMQADEIDCTNVFAPETDLSRYLGGDDG